MRNEKIFKALFIYISPEFFLVVFFLEFICISSTIAWIFPDFFLNQKLLKIFQKYFRFSFVKFAVCKFNAHYYFFF